MKANFLSLLLLVGSIVITGCDKKESHSHKSINPNLKSQEELSKTIAQLRAEHNAALNEIKKSQMAERLKSLEEKLESKRTSSSLFESNTQKLIRNQLDGHTKVFNLKGNYKVLVIPVEFADKKFVDREYFKTEAQEYLFGAHKNSMTTYYKHSSLGRLNVTGEVVDPVVVDGVLDDYGEALPGGTNDKDPKGLVKQALLKLREVKTSNKWWESFDSWDLNDYDQDKHFYEPDGFIDAVVLIYAGKSQSSCQRSFDPEGERPGNSELDPADPQYQSKMECFSRLWPHRWALSLASDDPLYSEKGPLVEGVQRPSFNGLKITENLFALDYNMQSEFSDRSTFIHEFGHSLTLPDIYASSGTNTVGCWEVMAANGDNQAQEMSSFSKISLGWLQPKIIESQANSSFYLGHYNYVSNNQREGSYGGPTNNKEWLGDSVYEYDVLSLTPNFKEPVYRSAMVLAPKSVENVTVIEDFEPGEIFSAYSGRYDGDSRALNIKLKVPAEGDATLSFDTIYFIETETNFDSTEKDIVVTTDYDIGKISINGEAKEDLRLVSGDANFDTLNEANPNCLVGEVLSLREQKIAGSLDDAGKERFKSLTEICQKPVWIKKSYDLSALRGQTVELEVRYTTDAGYTEFGIVVDNIQLGDQKIGFESQEEQNLAGAFELIENGKKEITFTQFYLMEYRDPQVNFLSGEDSLSHNMDQNIDNGSQSMFVGEGTPKDQFRLLRTQYQPGVLLWYFNSRFDRRQNSTKEQDGKGYLLVVNPKIQEMVIPGAFAQDSFFAEDGFYLDPDKDEAFGSYVKNQNDQLICFGYTEYATYLTGIAPDCSQFDPLYVNYLTELTLDGRKLIYRREGFNEVLPKERFANYGVGKPFRVDSYIRTALSTFRPASSPEFNPFLVYKVDGQEMVLDEQIMSEQKSYSPVSSFSDKAIRHNPDHLEDSSVVEPVGFNFKVIEPSERNIAGYSKNAGADDNQNIFRKPKVKIVIDWE